MVADDGGLLDLHCGAEAIGATNFCIFGLDVVLGVLGELDPVRDLVLWRVCWVTCRWIPPLVGEVGSVDRVASMLQQGSQRTDRIWAGCHFQLTKVVTGHVEPVPACCWCHEPCLVDASELAPEVIFTLQIHRQLLFIWRSVDIGPAEGEISI